MGRRKKYSVESRYHREYQHRIGNFVIERGETIKIEDVHGVKFKFDAIVTNIETGSKWVDCFELHKGAPSGLRAFRVERIKRIPKKRARRVKSVN